MKSIAKALLLIACLAMGCYMIATGYPTTGWFLFGLTGVFAVLYEHKY